LEEKVKPILDFLNGKKTYIIAIILAVINLLVACEVLPHEAVEPINFVLAGLGLGTLRLAVKKGE